MADKGTCRLISISAPTALATRALDALVAIAWAAGSWERAMLKSEIYQAESASARHPLGTEGAHHLADSHLVSGVGCDVEAAQRSF
jgi:hypothetical protein